MSSIHEMSLLEFYKSDECRYADGSLCGFAFREAVHQRMQGPQPEPKTALGFADLDSKFDYPEFRKAKKHIGERVAMYPELVAAIKKGNMLPVATHLAAFNCMGFGELERYTRCTFELTGYVAMLLGITLPQMYGPDRKFNTGEWTRVPWANAEWFRDSPHAAVHKLHMSTEKKGAVAYVENKAKLLKDVYTSCGAGRYLSKFFSHVLDQGQIKYWSELAGGAEVEYDLKFIEGHDKEGWQRIYRDGPQSCMQGAEEVHVYAHKDSVLRLAYATHKHSDRPTARAIVREDMKNFIRVYPNPTGSDEQIMHTRMVHMLEAAGYQRKMSLVGVELDAHEHHDKEGWFYMPYIDSDESFHFELVKDRSRVLLAAGSRRHDWSENESNLVCIDGDPEEETRTCDICDCAVPEDDTTYVDNTDQRVCRDCLDEHFTYAYGRRHEDWYSNDDNEIVEVNGNYYLTEYASNHDIYQCEETEEWYHMDDLRQTSRGLIHEDLCEELDVEDSNGNNWAHSDDAVETWDGRTIHQDDAQELSCTLVIHEDDDITDEADVISALKAAA